jgi:3-hydroxybutyryl-CoA dehydrogenase
MSQKPPVAILGAGTMGHGIAQLTAQRGYPTRLFDVSQQAADAGQAKVQAALARLADKGKLSPEEKQQILGNITPTDDLRRAVEGASLVIEAAPEKMELKVELFTRVIEAAPADALLASNTSSLSITELGQRTGQAHRVLGLHFFNPPPVMELLEIVRGVATSEESLARASELARDLGKTSILVRDFPGFATSRLGVVIGAEAMRMAEQGVASVVDIDRAMELGYRHPMGPLKLTDLVGLDVRLSILDHLHKELGEAFRPPALLRQLVRAGRLGKKTGIGFYRWTDKGPEPAPFLERFALYFRSAIGEWMPAPLPDELRQRAVDAYLRGEGSSKEVAEQVLLKNHIRLVFLPPYAHDLNPIKHCWSKVKEHPRAAAARSVEALDQAIAAALHAITLDDIAGWFKHAGYVLD